MNSWKLDVGWLFSFVTHQLPRINCLVMLKYDSIESLYLYLIEVYFRTIELDQSYRKLCIVAYGIRFRFYIVELVDEKSEIITTSP